MAENGRSLWRAVRPPAAPRGTRTCTARCRGNADQPRAPLHAPSTPRHPDRLQSPAHQPAAPTALNGQGLQKHTRQPRLPPVPPGTAVTRLPWDGETPDHQPCPWDSQPPGLT